MKKILLHSCCAPCSGAVLERLATDFRITIYYYNPNIDTPLEFMRRAEELEKLTKLGIDFDVVTEEYRPDEYNAAVRGLESLGEGSQRCYECYKLRLGKTADYAARHGYDFFTTTLSVSPHKKVAWIHEIGRELERATGVRYLDEDFKKRDGYRRSLELSRTLKLYRQNYCGCKYSKAEAERRSQPMPSTTHANCNAHKP
ncbi:MAG: epoxyqueuosine reductase QueH [Candidatus Nomurabacteria bacterium]|jgi:predicted adenine nucleotide alpha hydrolase (AANH) superfamily ATPase|nr:epoxyqueuosine reductase QueH [Candidatus Nomurabacteria bacterium]